MVGYDKHAAQDSRVKMLAFFIEHLGSDAKKKVASVVISQKTVVKLAKLSNR